ncbi:MAG: hypothetical protein ACTSQG_05145 [Promethearchaeota archaeon]
MFMSIKFLIIWLINIGFFPFLAFLFFNLGYIQATFIDLIWLIVFVEFIFGTYLLIHLTYQKKDTGKINKILQ